MKSMGIFYNRITNTSFKEKLYAAMRAITITLSVIMMIFIMTGCSIGARVEKGTKPEPVYASVNHQHESFLRLVFFVRKHSNEKPTEQLVLTAQTHVYNAGFNRECRGKDCFFVYEDKEIVVSPEYIEIRKRGSSNYVRFYNMEVAMKVIYNLRE